MLENWKKKIGKLFRIPQRCVIGIMGFFCMTIAYMLRMCLNIAITQMVASKEPEEIHDPEVCSYLDVSIGNFTSSHGEYNWDEETQGIILGAFYYGYIVTQIPCGFIIDKYGAKYPLGIGIGITALMTLITPVVVKAGKDDPTGLIVVRVIEGLAEGPAVPATAALMSRWTPKYERGTMSGFVYGGADFGCILGTVISGYAMAEDKDWPRVFYIFGGIGVLWFMFWQVLVYDDPRVHPFISDNERQFLESEIDEQSTKTIPWKAMICSMPVWAIFIMCIGGDWGNYTLTTDLPKYMHDVLKFDIAKTGLLSSFPYMMMWLFSNVFGIICDWCIKRNYVSIKNGRKIFSSIGGFGTAIFVVAASYAGCNRVLTVIMFCTAMGMMGAFNTGFRINVSDLTPNFSGTAMALINGFSAITGIVTPYIVGYFTPNQTQSEWRVAFWIIFAVMSGTNIFYLIFAQGEVQWWNDTEKHPLPEKNFKYSGSKTK